MESVLREEAAACGVAVTYCLAGRDPLSGVVLRWAVDGDPQALISRLGRYAFAQEMISIRK